MTDQPKPKLAVQIIPVTPLQQNCSMVWHTETMEGVLIDAGGDTARLIEAAEKQGVKITKLWLTHGHLDHAGAADEIREKTGAPIEGPHKDDQWLMDEIEEQGAKYGIVDGRNVTPDRYLVEGDTLELCGETFHVLHTPGHTPGHVVIYHEGARIAFVGDVIFQGSIGRTDFPKGNFQQLVDSITQKLWPLGNDMNFVPGHGPMSTFGQERKTNGFVSDHIIG